MSSEQERVRGEEKRPSLTPGCSPQPEVRQRGELRKAVGGGHQGRVGEREDYKVAVRQTALDSDACSSEMPTESVSSFTTMYSTNTKEDMKNIK